MFAYGLADAVMPLPSQNPVISYLVKIRNDFVFLFEITQVVSHVYVHYKSCLSSFDEFRFIIMGS